MTVCDVRSIWLLLVLGVLGVSLCRAQGASLPEAAEARGPVESEVAARLLEKGRYEVLDFRLYEAERTFRRLARHPDARPVAGYYLVTLSYLKALVTDERAYVDEFLERADSLQHHLEAMPDAPWTTYFLAEVYLYRAFVEVKRNRLLRSALAGRKAYGYFEKLIASDAAFYEPYKGLGLMHLFIGTMPRSQRRLLRILGYGGTVHQGMQELRYAAEHSRLSREEAAIYLALSDITLNNSADGGVERLAQLYEARPESALLAHLYGFALLSNRRAAEAEQALQAAVHAGTTADYFYIDYAAFYLAQALFRQNRFEEAEPYYRRYLERHRGAALRSQAYYELGLTLEMQGRREAALAMYAQVDEDRTFETDRAARRAARTRGAAPMPARVRDLLLGRNAYDAGAYDRAEALLRPVLDDPEAEPTAKAEAAYRLGRVYQALGRLDDARQAYHYAVDHPGDDPEAAWAPWSQFYLGEIHAQYGDVSQARQALEDALAYRGPFDYDQALEQQAKAAISRLEEHP